MFYLRYKLHSLNNAMLESQYSDRLSVLAYYQSIWQNVVYAALWHTELGFIYTIV